MGIKRKRFSAANAKKSVQVGPLRRVDDSPVVVRFLYEQDQEAGWAEIEQVYDSANERFLFLEEGESHPKADILYLAVVAVKEETFEGDVEYVPVVMQLKKSLCKLVTEKAEALGTIMDRDFKLYRSGQGKKIRYGVSDMTPKKMGEKKINKLRKAIDLDDVMEEALNAQNESDD